MENKNKVVGIIMTYNCAKMIGDTYSRLPKEIFDEIIVVDDDSKDNTVETAEQIGIPVYTHPHSGYGGNLEFGLKKAVELGADHIAEIHGDGQYSLEAIKSAFQKLADGYDLILGNRFYDMRQPFRDGMSPIRYVGNLALSALGRFGIGIPTKDIFTGTRTYSRKLVETLDFRNNNRGYFFSFEIVAQARYCGLKIGWVPTRCNYNKEHSSMNLWGGVKEIFQTSFVVVLYWLTFINIKRGIFAPLKNCQKKTR